jgi:hypothetical protein
VRHKSKNNFKESNVPPPPPPPSAQTLQVWIFTLKVNKENPSYLAVLQQEHANIGHYLEIMYITLLMG